MEEEKDMARCFFTSWAQLWCEEFRAARKAYLLATDCHAPNEYRVNGPLSMMAEFHWAYDVKPGQRMWRPKDERVELWGSEE